MISVRDKSQIGRSMIEMLGVLAIVGILSAGGIAGYSMAMQSHKTNAFIEKLQLIAQRTRELYKGDYTGADMQDLIDAGLITDASSPFGEEFGLRNDYQFGGSSTFTIWTRHNNVPAEVCVKLLTHFWGDCGVIRGLNIDTTMFRCGGTGVTLQPYPPTKDAAISVCKGGNKQIHWVFL